MEKKNLDKVESEKPKNRRRRCRSHHNRSLCHLDKIVPDHESKDIQMKFESEKFNVSVCETDMSDLDADFVNFKLNWFPIVPLEDANQMLIMQKIQRQQLQLQLEEQYDISFSDSSDEEEVRTWVIDPIRGGMAQMPRQPKIPPFFYCEQKKEDIVDWTEEEKLNM